MQLSLSRVGLGLCRLSEHSSACYIASLSMAGMCSETNQHLLNAINKFNEHVSNEETVTLEAIRETPCHQKVLSNKWEDSLFAQLFSKSSLPDRARLLSVPFPQLLLLVSIYSWNLQSSKQPYNGGSVLVSQAPMVPHVLTVQLIL